MTEKLPSILQPIGLFTTMTNNYKKKLIEIAHFFEVTNNDAVMTLISDSGRLL